MQPTPRAVINFASENLPPPRCAADAGCSLRHEGVSLARKQPFNVASFHPPRPVRQRPEAGLSAHGCFCASPRRGPIRHRHRARPTVRDSSDPGLGIKPASLDETERGAKPNNFARALGRSAAGRPESVSCLGASQQAGRMWRWQIGSRWHKRLWPVSMIDENRCRHC